MFLLNRFSRHVYPNLCFPFTFQYVSIKSITIVCSIISFLIFTFQYVSIKSRTNLSLAVTILFSVFLSTALLAKIYQTTILRKYIYMLYLLSLSIPWSFCTIAHRQLQKETRLVIFLPPKLSIQPFLLTTLKNNN